MRGKQIRVRAQKRCFNAKAIASLLKRETGFDFSASKGIGLGYTEDEHQFVFTVHLNHAPQ